MKSTCSNSMNQRITCLSALGLLFIGDSVASAGEPAPAPMLTPVEAETSEWDFGFRPYLWMTGLEGTLGVNGVTAPVDMEFSDILDNLEMVWASTLEARRGKWGVMLDFTYLRLGDSTIPVFSAAPIAPYGFEMEMFLIDLVGSYRAVEWNGGYLDLTGGVRWMSIENTIDLATAAGSAGSVVAKDDWFDPHVGLRVHHDLSPRTYVQASGDVGGFGVGSDFTCQAIAAFGFRVSECLSLEFGYRYLKEDYDNSPSFSFDADMQGPILGINYTW